MNILVFIILGSQKFQFNRLLEYIDKLIEEGIIDNSVVCQSGYSDYTPKYFSKQPFLDKESFLENISDSQLVITHGGTGAIINSLSKNKKIIAIPRESQHGEHVDNHQYEITEVFKKSGYILTATSYEELTSRLKESVTFCPKKFTSNNDRFLDSLERIINDVL